MFLPQELLRAVREKVDAVLVLELDLSAIAIEQRSVERMRRVFKRICAFPQIEEASAIFGLDVAGPTACSGFTGGEMPLTDQV